MLTLDIIGEAAFGSKIEAQNSSDSPIASALEFIVANAIYTSFTHCIISQAS